jgi:hypothetical protein
MLRCSIAELDRVEQWAESLYRVAKRERKSDGKMRVCYDAKPPLKSMQGRIKCMILRHVKFPAYLMGGISDLDRPRDYVRNAAIHAGARVLVNEDITEFFPSTSAAIVYDIWRYFFRFPDEVARTLTALTTKDGGLPQGAKTSSYLANLVFWSTEPAAARTLRQMGFQYSRYVDDISISSQIDRSPRDLGRAISVVAFMVRRRGLHLKRRKHRIMRAGQRMEVTGLVVNEHSASLGPKKAANIRAVVHQSEALAKVSPRPPEFERVKRRAVSLVGQLNRLHPGKARTLRERLRLAR